MARLPVGRKNTSPPYFDAYNGGPGWCWWDEWDRQGPDWIECPYGKYGNLLWVRETFKRVASGHVRDGYGEVRYGFGFQADGETSWQPYVTKIWDLAGQPDRGPMQFNPQPWKPSIHLPRHASRLTLELTGVRVERLQDISEADAKAEGLATLTKDGGRTWKFGIPDADGLPGNDDFGWHWQEWEVDPRKAYARLWESINGAGAWAANTWVWVLQFQVHHQNVDALIQQRRAAA